MNFKDLNSENEISEEGKKIYSGLPIKSNYKNIKQYKNNKLKKGEVGITNYNFNGLENELINLFEEFLDKIYEFDDRPHKRGLKKFIAEFSEVAMNKGIRKIDEIDFKLLELTMKFFLEDEKKIEGYEQEIKSARGHLLKFYRFIIERKIDCALSEIEKDIIKSHSIMKILNENYTIVDYNPLENIPKENKFCFFRNKNTMSGGKSTNDKMYYVDLSDVKENYAEDIKEYIWYSKKSIKRKVGYVYIIKKFLEIREGFYKFKNKELINDYILSEEVILVFNEYVDNEYDNFSMRASIKTEVKSFLNFHKLKYNFNDSLKSMMVIKKPSYMGGNPIEQEDLQVIYQEFVKDAKKIKNNIFKIVFEINLYSNLRIGDILNLRRNCIVDEKSILVDGKMTDGNFEKVEVNDEVIRLIKAGIKETEEIVDNTIIGEYIFISERKSNFVKSIKIIDFRTKFLDILDKCKDNLNRKDYTPYNLRDTFINSAYEYGIKNKLELNEISKITGNSYETAVKHYRKRECYELYVEQLAKVNIRDGYIDGKVVKIEEFGGNKVRGNLGECIKEKCNFNIGECLMCNNFVTSTNRIDVFISRISEIHKILEKTIDKFERKRLNNEKILLAKYLYNMYKIREKDNG